VRISGIAVQNDSPLGCIFQQILLAHVVLWDHDFREGQQDRAGPSCFFQASLF